MRIDDFNCWQNLGVSPVFSLFNPGTWPSDSVHGSLNPKLGQEEARKLRTDARSMAHVSPSQQLRLLGECSTVRRCVWQRIMIQRGMIQTELSWNNLVLPQYHIARRVTAFGLNAWLPICCFDCTCWSVRHMLWYLFRYYFLYQQMHNMRTP